jgi:2-isopropylmalate synthase
VHAAAIAKAERKGHRWLADRVYSGVPASMVGRRQEIEVSPMSGLSNVRYWLEAHGYDPDDDALVGRLFDAAKHTDHTLSEEELETLVNGA